jgi:hypothetical protein
MRFKIMNTWTYEKDIYFLPCFRLNFYENQLNFFFAFLTVGIYNYYTKKVDHLQEYYDEL